MEILTFNTTPLFEPLKPQAVRACADNNSITLSLDADDYSRFLDDSDRYCAVAQRFGFDTLLMQSGTVERRYPLKSSWNSESDIG